MIIQIVIIVVIVLMIIMIIVVISVVINNDDIKQTDNDLSATKVSEALVAIQAAEEGCAGGLREVRVDTYESHIHIHIYIYI